MKTIILVELHGLQVSKSMKIQYKNTDLYLYPRKYFKTIDDMDTIIQKIRESPNNSNTMQINNFIRFDIGNEKFTYLVCEFPIQIYSRGEILLKNVTEFFDLFTRINSFIFDFFITYSSISIFKKASNGYRLLRVMKFDFIIDKNKDYVTEYRLEGYANKVTQLISRIQDSELLTELIQLFYGFVAAMTEPGMEKRITSLWNFLENLTNIYSSNLGRNLLINNYKYQQLKGDIGNILAKNLEMLPLIPLNIEQFNHELGALLNQLNQSTSIPLGNKEWRNLKKIIRCQIQKTIDKSDILIKNYTKNKIQELLIQKLDNFPPIKELINLMCKDIHYNLNDFEISIINRLNMIRNYLFHKSIKLSGLYKIIKEKPEMEHYNFQYLKSNVASFEKIIQRITAKLFHSSLLRDKRRDGKKKNYRYHPELVNERSADEYFINILKKIKIDYMHQEKFADIIRLKLESAKNFHNKFLFNLRLKVCCVGEKDKVIIPFQLEFKNIFRAKGRFTGNIGYPKVYAFYIDLREQAEDLNIFLRFKAHISMSFTSNSHRVRISALDCWYNNN